MILYIIFIKLFFSQKTECLDISATELLNKLNIPKLSFKEVQLWKEIITKDDIFENLKSIKDNKIPGNDEFLNEFYETLWNILAKSFLNSIKTAALNNELSSFQKQAVIRLIEKRTEINTS